MTFLLCDPGWYVQLDVQNEWEETHTHTHTLSSLAPHTFCVTHFHCSNNIGAGNDRFTKIVPWWYLKWTPSWNVREIPGVITRLDLSGENEQAGERRDGRTCLPRPNAQALTGTGEKICSLFRLATSRIGNLTRLRRPTLSGTPWRPPRSSMEVRGDLHGGPWRLHGGSWTSMSLHGAP